MLGAFQLAIPVRLGDVLLPRETRKLAALRYMAQGIPAGDRWAPVFTRYLAQIADKIRGLGGDPNSIAPSLDDPGPVSKPPTPEKLCITGKVCEVIYDCFGEFEGFALASCDGMHGFCSAERGIEVVVRRAHLDGAAITVCLSPGRKHHICQIILGCR